MVRPAMTGEVVIDFRDVTQFMGVSGDVAKFLDSPAFRNKFQRALQRVGAVRFGEYMDRQSMSRPEELFHVYEWGSIGKWNGRLFQVKFQGRGAQSQAWFEFKQSKKAVPFERQGSRPADDTRTSRHVFRAKAWVMEKGLEVTITPSFGKVLAWPEGGKMGFGPRARVRIGATTQGQFGSSWDHFWNSVADAAVAEPLASGTDKILQHRLSEIVTLGTRSKRIAANKWAPHFRFRAVGAAEQMARNTQVARNIDRDTTVLYRKLDKGQGEDIDM